jgi:hypothetical protein
MSNKKLIVLALVGVMILAVVLSLALSKKNNKVVINRPAPTVYSPKPATVTPSADTTTGPKAVKSSVDVIADNVKTNVNVQ